jgi:hypothetical protein
MLRSVTVRKSQPDLLRKWNGIKIKASPTLQKATHADADDVRKLMNGALLYLKLFYAFIGPATWLW